MSSKTNEQQFTNATAKEMFAEMIAAAKAAGDKDSVARIEIVREFTTNPEFRASLEQFCWQARK